MKKGVFYAMLFLTGISLMGCGASPKVEKRKNVVDEKVILLQKAEREVSQFRVELYKNYEDFLSRAKEIMQNEK